MSYIGHVAENSPGRTVLRSKKGKTDCSGDDRGAHTSTIPHYTVLLGDGHALCGWAHVRAGHPADSTADLRRAHGLWEKGKPTENDTLFERSSAGLAGRTECRLEVQHDRGPGEAFADQSVVALADAVTTGWADPSELREPDFDALRGRADFQELVAEVEVKAEKLPDTAPPPRKTK